MHDVIIVGARVAGSATALLLARAGLKVLVVDRAAFPSDTLSTHQVQVPGVARLARWGLLDAIMAAGTPPTRSVRFDQGAAAFTARIPACDGVDMMCSPRRTLLDKVLLDAARAAGAEVRENFITEDLLADGGTVTGIRGQEKGSPSVTEHARLVIGADGKHSTVARAVGRAATAPGRRGRWRSTPTGPTCRSRAVSCYARPGCAVGAWPTNDGLVMTYLAWPNARFGEFRADPEGTSCARWTPSGWGAGPGRAARRALPRHPRPAQLLPPAVRAGLGPGGRRRAAAGPDHRPGHRRRVPRRRAARATRWSPGWAATGRWPRRWLDYQRARDRAARPMHDFTARLAALSPPSPGEIALFEALSRSQPDADRFIAMLAGVVPVREFMSPRTIVGLVGVRGFARLVAGQARRGPTAHGPRGARARRRRA